jgi:hypothetical protein
MTVRVSDLRPALGLSGDAEIEGPIRDIQRDPTTGGFRPWRGLIAWA